MNIKTTFLLFAGLIACLVVLALTQLLGYKTSGDKDVYVFPSLHKDVKKTITAKDIDSVDIELLRPKVENLTFARNGQNWELQQPYSARLDSGQVTRFINQVIEARREKTDTGANLKDRVDSPAAVVTLKKGSSEEWKLTLGKQSPPGANMVVYALSSDKPNDPLAVKCSELSTFFTKETVPLEDKSTDKGSSREKISYRFMTAKDVLSEFRTKELLGGAGVDSANRIRYVQLLDPSKKQPVILVKNSEGNWRFEKPPYGDVDEEGEPRTGGIEPNPNRINGMKDLLNAIEAVRADAATDFVEENVKDLAQYGLEAEKPVKLSVEIKRKATNPEDNDFADTLLIGKYTDDKKDKFYARLASERNVVKVPAASVDKLIKAADDPAALRNRDLVRVDARKIDAVDVKNAGGSFELRKPQSTWKIIAGDTKARSADDQEVQGTSGLLSVLTDKRKVKEFPDPAKEKELGFDKPEAVVSLWADGIKKDEDKKDEKKEEKKDADAKPSLKEPSKPTVKLIFGKRTSDAVYVRREAEGDTTLLAVPTSILDKVNQKPVAYLDKTLPSFSEHAEITQLVLDRGGEVYDIKNEQKEDKGKPIWKLTQPKDLAGRAADAGKVDRILRDLRELHPEKLEAEQGADLDKFGLKAPQVKATVQVKNADKKTEDWVYLFGKETEDKSGVYAKMNKSDFVFVVFNRVVDTLKGELQDPTVFQFDRDKVKEIKVTGWHKVIGVPLTLDLERKSSIDWTVKAPAGSNLDPAQAESLLTDLASLKAERFVVRKTGPKPEYELSEKVRSLFIEIFLEGEKEPLTLTLGKLDEKEKGYYAQSNKLPGDVFLVPQHLFEKRLGGPKYFMKGGDAAK